jgi:Arc/MetJ-type ribon-helix-helix transcriptional regulator
MRKLNMKTANYQRFAISVPEGMAMQIEDACKSEGRNRSEFFREAVRHYMGTHNGKRTPSSIMPISTFHPFTEWGSKGDAVYDSLGILSAKDRELAHWAQMVETDPVFADVRAVSDDVNNVAGEAIH